MSLASSSPRQYSFNLSISILVNSCALPLATRLFAKTQVPETLPDSLIWDNHHRLELVGPVEVERTGTVVASTRSLAMTRRIRQTIFSLFSFLFF